MLLLHPTVRPEGPFTWSLEFHASVVIGVTALALAYLLGATRWRARHCPGLPFPAGRAACFLAGLLVLTFSLNGPIHDLSDYYLFSGHMLQHLLLMLVVPPLLIVGTPGWLLDPVLDCPGVEPAARFLTHPVVAGLAFSLTMILWHLPGPYDLMMRNHDVHIATHLLFMATATMMWWPVMSPTDRLPRLTPGLQMLYLFLVGIPMQAVAAPISLSDTVLYHWYTEAPRTWGLSPLEDQQLGGLLMWVPGGFYLAGAIAIVFFKWAAAEARADRLSGATPAE